MSSADDDAVDGAVTCTITHNVESADPKYDVLVTTAQASVTDFELARILLTAGTLALDEATPATTDGITAVLDARPSAAVTLTLSSTDGQTAHSAGGATSQTLTFTSLNWASPQTANLYVVDDFIDEDASHAGQVGAAVASTADGYGDPAVRDVVVDGTLTAEPLTLSVTVADNDTFGVLLTEPGGGTQVIEGGATDSYSVRLGTVPAGDVTVTADPAAGCDVGAGAGVLVTRTFAPGNWNIDQGFTVSVVDQVVGASPRTCTVTHDVASAVDAAYDASTLDPVQVQVTDDDDPIVVVSSTAGVGVSEATPATTDAVSVVLQNRPDGDVAVTLTVTDGQTTVDGAAASTLTFTTANWDNPQGVAVAAVDDDVDETDPHPGSAALSVTSTATRFGAVSYLVDGVAGTTVAVSVADDDVAALEATDEDTLAVEQGRSATPTRSRR